MREDIHFISRGYMKWKETGACVRINVPAEGVCVTRFASANPASQAAASMANDTRLKPHN